MRQTAVGVRRVSVSPARATWLGIVMLHEILGITLWIEEVADQFASRGYCVVSPDMFWRLEPGFVADYRIPEEREKGMRFRGEIKHDKAVEDISAAIDNLKARPECNGKIAVVGYCMGGTLTYLSAARLNPDAAVVYYGTEVQFLGRRTDYFLSDDLPRGRSRPSRTAGAAQYPRCAGGSAKHHVPRLRRRSRLCQHASTGTVFSWTDGAGARAVVRSFRYASLISYSSALQADSLYSEAEKHQRRQRQDGFRADRVVIVRPPLEALLPAGKGMVPTPST